MLVNFARVFSRIFAGATYVAYLTYSLHQIHVYRTPDAQVRAIRMLDQGRKRAIFMISANDSPDDIRLYLDAGADGQLSVTCIDSQIIPEDAVPRTHVSFRT